MEDKNKVVNSIGEIDFTNGENIKFLATVISILDEGDGASKPFKAVLKLEMSGENLTIASWKFDLLNDFKLLLSLDSVYSFEGKASLYKDKDKQVKIEAMHDAGFRSTKKILKVCNINSIINEINTIIREYVHDSTLLTLLSNLIQNNEKFYQWPAATKLHHAYEGGLAKHSLGVCKNAISIWKNYNGSNCNIELLVTAALLHDIGKIQEYTKDGSRTTYGNLIGHPVIGADKIFRVALENNLDPEKDLKLIMLRSIILSHHEKLEFGSPVTPGILEAVIIAQADDLDARVEAGDAALELVNIYGTTNNIGSLDGAKLFKWHD